MFSCHNAIALLGVEDHSPTTTTTAISTQVSFNNSCIYFDCGYTDRSILVNYLQV